MGKTSNPTSPHHYSRWKIQPLRFCRENRIDFVRGNCLKYLLRHDEKDGLQDLKKAFVYFMQHALEAYGPAACAETECPTTAAAIAAKQNKRFIRNILSERSYMVLYRLSRYRSWRVVRSSSG